MNDSTTFEDRYNKYIAAQAEANDRNKANTFEALASAGITKVTVIFDGSGDDGQIVAVFAFIGETGAVLPPAPVQLEHVSWAISDSSTVQEPPLPEAIESICYGYLSKLHDGWENNDGACGEFTFDVAKRSIELEFNARYTEYSTDSHTL